MKILKAQGLEPIGVVYWVRHWGKWYWVDSFGHWVKAMPSR